MVIVLVTAFPQNPQPSFTTDVIVYVPALTPVKFQTTFSPFPMILPAEMMYLYSNIAILGLVTFVITHLTQRGELDLIP
jgi:hypothetical protein